MPQPNLFAGAIAERSIQPGSFGLAYAYGELDACRVTGYSAAGMDGTQFQTALTSTLRQHVELYPLAAFVAGTTYYGYFGLHSVASNTATGAIERHALCRGLAVPVDTQKYGGTYATFTFASGGTIKAFIKAI
jgi:hypothetical protein